jgi:phosphoribosylformylglycinamidine synthase
MTKAIQILSKNLTGKENILIKETKSQAIKILDSYLFSQNIKNVNFNKISSILTNRVSQIVLTNNNYEKLLSNYGNFNWVIEIKFLPGVTDNIANTATEMIGDNITSYKKNFTVGSSNIYLIRGNKDIAEKIAKKESNPLIHSIRIISYQRYLNDFKNNKFLLQDVNLPDKKYLKKDINLDISDKQLSLIGRLGIEETDKSRRGTLGLDLLSMQSIKEYFNKIRRKPTDVEIETLAQTWSEHCKHKIFSAKIDELDDGIFKTFIKGATEKIIKQRKDNFCVSLFTDNAGAVEFNKDWLVCHKVETHNTPSALDPFGGSITGIVGVNRDCLGFGKGAKPIANTYAYYLANPNKKYNLYRQKNKKDPMLQASYIANGVISGVRVGGNCSGIPTPQGNIYFDDRFAGKPLVFCGTVGLIPKKINKKLSHIKKANHNDLIIMVGGRVGKDGIHGATFSSEELDPNSPVSAVQIGDPITQKKLSDVIIKELRDRDLYTSITDNGAGGLSSSIGEMAKESGGFIVNLEKIPLKYKGLYPWEIWISESQERMTLAVKPKNAKSVIKIFKQRGVEATIIGKFTKQKKAVVKYNRTVVLNLDMNFLHEGYPKLKLKTKKPTYQIIKKK